MNSSVKTVLLVEDDDIVRGAMQIVLEWEGYQVASATNGQEALDILRQADPPSLVLLDLMLPVLDGWKVREAQMADPTIASIPVIVVSSLDRNRSPDAAGHITKPFQVDELLKAVRHHQASPL